MKGEWRRPQDELPKEGEQVLCYGPRGGWFIAEVFIKHGRAEWHNRSNHNPHPVAWMPLPEVWEGEKSGKETV